MTRNQPRFMTKASAFGSRAESEGNYRAGNAQLNSEGGSINTADLPVLTG